MKHVRQSFRREAPDQRRSDLIVACARCLAKDGAHGTSVRTICAEAGVSPGLLRHYFAGVDDLVAETYRDTGDRVQAALDAAVAIAPDVPRTRLLAYLTASFAPAIADPDLLATWLAFWSLTKTDARIAAVHADIYCSYRTGLETLIADLTPGDHRLTAIALTALVDGLWLELSLGEAPFTAAEAAELAERWLDALLR
jgi:TetR/AcrR family transcriptional regulator, transcriptional repressor of bet genes